MYYVYILKSKKDNSFYKGSTKDIKLRLIKHNSGEVNYTSKKRPWILVWYCGFSEKSKALKFEHYLKEGSGFAFAKKYLI